MVDGRTTPRRTATWWPTAPASTLDGRLGTGRGALRFLKRAGLALVCLVAAALGSVPAAAASVPGAADGLPMATSVSSPPRAVGALFRLTDGQLGSHFCTASVVDSGAGDLILTAAHCVSGGASGLAFAPDYHDGRAPLGLFRVTRVVTSAAWSSSADPDDDFAFLVVGRSASGATVEHLTGAERVGGASSLGQHIVVDGYPDGATSPITCENGLQAFSPTQLQFDCGGYTDGTSGSPFLSDVSPRTGLGTVVGVIGGYQLGGDTPQVSYAARFGVALDALYRHALAVASSPAR